MLLEFVNFLDLVLRHVSSEFRSTYIHDDLFPCLLQLERQLMLKLRVKRFGWV